MEGVGTVIGSLLMDSLKLKELGFPDASMLKCRKANECMLNFVFEDLIGEPAPERDPKGNGSVFHYLITSIRKKIKKEEIQRSFNAKKFQSINRMTRGHMHHKNVSKESSNISEFIDIKGWKASGNKIASYLRMSGFEFLDGEVEEVEKETINDEISSDAFVDNDTKDDTDNDLTLF